MPGPLPTRLFLVVVSACCLAALPATPSGGGLAVTGGPGHAGANPDAGVLWDMSPPTPEVFTARTLARLARLDLRLTDDPTHADFALAGTLLGIAQELDPENMTIIRRRLEAAVASGDNRLVEELTQRLVRLNPSDEVSLLRLIAAKVSEEHTGEARLDRLDRFVAQDALPATVRSRLALDAALLARESGDMHGFADRLARAVELDSTHKEAAVVAATYYGDSLGDPLGSLDVLLNLLLADPIDPNLHRRVAAELAEGGAFVAARRFLINASNLTSLTPAGIPDDVSLRGLTLSWRTDGPVQVTAALNAQTQRIRTDAQRNAQLGGQAFDPLAPALPVPYEKVRALSALAAGDEATLDDSLNQMESILRWVTRDAEAAAAAGGDSTNYILAREAARLDLVIMRLWTGRQYERVAADAELLLTQPHESIVESDTMIALTPLLKLRTGDAQAAIDALEPRADEAALFRVVLAMAYEAVGREKESLEMLRRLATTNTLSAPSAWAYDKLRVAGKTGGLFPHAQGLTKAAGVGAWLDTMCSDPRRFVSVEVSGPTEGVHPLAPAELTIRLRNHSPVAMSVGPGKVLNTSFLFTPKIDAGASFLSGAAVPEFVDATTRLRLGPNETVEYKVDAELGFAGLAIEVSCLTSSRVRWTVTQGPRTDQEGRWEPGPLCVATDSGQIVRPIAPEMRFLSPTTAEGISAAVQRITSSPDEAMPVILGTLRAWLPGAMPLAQSEVSFETVTAIAAACAERYPRLPPHLRAAMLAALPTAAAAPGMGALDAAAATETHPAPCLVYLITRVSAVNDPVLATMLSSSDPVVARAAQTIKDRLESDRSGYARRFMSGGQ